MANIFVWFLANIICWSWRRGAASSEYHTGRKLYCCCCCLYIKDFFWDIFRVSSLDTIVGELLDTGFTYLVWFLCLSSLLRTVWWEWECLRRLFKFLFWAAFALYVFWIIITGAGTLSNILKHFQICDVSLLLYNLSLTLLQYSNFCNNLSKFGDCVQLIQPISFFGKELILHPERFLESRDWKTKLLKAKVNLRCFTSAVLCFQTHFGLFKIICIFMEIVILVLETRKLDIVGSLLFWILGTTKWQSLYCVCKQQVWLRGPCELSGARTPSTPGTSRHPLGTSPGTHYWAACPNWWTGLSWDNEERDLKRPSLCGLCA